MSEVKRKARQKQVRAWRVRKRIRGTAERPRLTVFRSNKHIYAQLIDDARGHSMCAASTAETAICPAGDNGGNRAAAASVGKAIAERALAAGIQQVAFDRGAYRYHGRVAALAEAARAGGLVF
ncbi:MAG: 50S ribosomal protein L18 [Planctomycetaceae bacterium]|nr:MAG: 50S ribosomal protein L18 [Planctomycetaceae bacterium]